MSVTRRVTLGAALAAPVVLRRARAQAEPVSVGALYPFSGVLALLGDESYRGLELASDERNGAGGLFGRPIKLVKGDAVDPNAAAAEARRLIGTEKVACIFGTCASALAAAASQVSELAGVPYFELGAISDAITARGLRDVYRTCPVASAFAELGTETVHDRLAPLWGMPPEALRIGILYEDGLYGTAVSGFQQDRCKALGLNVVERFGYGLGTSDLSTAVQRLRGAEADLVLHTGYQNDTVLFFRQMRGVGWLPRMVMGAGGGYSLTDTASAIGSDFEGVLNVDFTPYAVNAAVASGAREVGAAYQRKYGSNPRSAHSLANFTGAHIFFDAIGRAGGFEKDKIHASVLTTDIAIGATPTGWGARFDAMGQNIRASPLVTQWQGGTLRTVLPEEAAVAALRPKLGD